MHQDVVFRGQQQAVGFQRIAPEKIILDPGFGFAKTLQHNLSLFKHMESLHALGRPLLVGVSRKSM
ncbi:dihydropteroate synthase, partial [Klebsiella pneumoniae]|uniref:dihydropteroate synthase n=1 Tax=Klebsiella pneumoniae TaxID=573 RepID=UPI00272F88AC